MRGSLSVREKCVVAHPAISFMLVHVGRVSFHDKRGEMLPYDVAL
jgi:hypothetical protein